MCMATARMQEQAVFLFTMPVSLDKSAGHRLSAVQAVRCGHMSRIQSDLRVVRCIPCAGHEVRSKRVWSSIRTLHMLVPVEKVQAHTGQATLRGSPCGFGNTMWPEMRRSQK
eukprot:scaffold170823_cov20-Tisochrysis_lutea.AAC.2